MNTISLTTIELPTVTIPPVKMSNIGVVDSDATLLAWDDAEAVAFDDGSIAQI